MTTRPFWGWFGVRRAVSLGFLAVALCALLVAATAVAGPGGSHWREGRVLLKVRSGLPEARLAKILAKYGGRKVLHRIAGRYVGRLEKLGVQEIDVPPGAEKRIVQALSENPNVEFVELDQLVELAQTTPNDPRYGSAWHLPKIQAPAAWDYALGDGVIVAILDTGVDPTHPDLLGRRSRHTRLGSPVRLRPDQRRQLGSTGLRRLALATRPGGARCHLRDTSAQCIGRRPGANHG
jgi:hypothetical protein